MEGVIVLTIGVLVSTGTFLLLQRRLLRLIMGLAFLSQATNLIIFLASKNLASLPPFIASDQQALTEASADPIPQALILTAIVIGFAMLACFVVLVQRTYRQYRTDNIDLLVRTDS